MAKRMTLKAWDKTRADERNDKRKGIKEGSPRDLKEDKKNVAKINKKRGFK